jgi:hypothetical protein
VYRKIGDKIIASLTKMTSDDEADQRVDLWIDCESVEDVADYAERGRKHAALSEGELTAAWVQAFRNFAQDIHDQELRAAPTDYSAEFRLRGKEPPHDLVRDDLQVVTDSIEKWMDSLTPEELDAFSERVEEVFSAFQDKRIGTKLDLRTA